MLIYPEKAKRARLGTAPTCPPHRLG